MEEKLGVTMKNDFHNINNLLNKITTHAGMTKYYLEKNGINSEKIEEEKTRFIKVMSGMEENAMKIGEILKKLRKNIHTKESRNEK
ncbi:MAG: hypothetical protein NTV71_02220 [Candidatus Omnitrophica bacterium]|nr:hypothetical protein [Candidatus Omnitrophota bacterium]